jgi:cell division protein FtsW
MLAIFLLLLGLGATSLLSASFVMAEFDKNDPYFFFRQQLLHLLVSLLVLLIIYFIPYWVLIRTAWLFAFLAVLVLIAMLVVPGFSKEVHKANRWMAFISFQPAEAAKLAVVILLARYFSYYKGLINKIGYGFIVPLFVMLTFGILIIAERDLGGALVIGIIVAIMMVIGGTRIYHLILLSPLIPLVYVLIHSFNYRSDRITAWRNPWIDPLNTGYNIIHSFYAFASGGVRGVGPGQSQQKMFFLPETHTDYIFAIIGEELGLIGVIIVSLLFLALAYRGFMIARVAKTLSGFYLAIGMTLCIFVPAYINMFVALSIIPAKGLPLPFFSYGGSSLLVSCTAMGILLGIYTQSLNDTGSDYIKIGRKGQLRFGSMIGKSYSSEVSEAIKKSSSNLPIKLGKDQG